MAARKRLTAAERKRRIRQVPLKPGARRVRKPSPGVLLHRQTAVRINPDTGKPFARKKASRKKTSARPVGSSNRGTNRQLKKLRDEGLI
jgi:hypothetical protein